MIDPRSSPQGQVAGSDFFKKTRITSFSMDPASVGSATAAEQDFDVSGVAAGDIILAFAPRAALSAGLGISHVRVKSAGVIAVTFINPTAGAINNSAVTVDLVYATPGSTAGVIS